MFRFVFIALVALALSAGSAFAQAKIEQAPIKNVNASDAKGMFDSYCAVCHGKEGKGNGPAASALAKVPADLTRINARNGGKFPDVRVRRYIEGLDEVAAHGSRDMPMWGGLFNSLNRDTAQLRVAALADYIKGMQVP
ncbi:MAG: c-type cytochrome [Acidobacteriota bacterium]|nr:c-type cytochrome [Acidobacteriota bacterium]MDP3718271.1 c-type cytochrome [Acidobacteriota bacterium]